MAAGVIHFGRDDCHYAQVLRCVGYYVLESSSMDDLRLDLQRDELVAAVILSVDDPQTTHLAATLVRKHSSAPLILFQRFPTTPDAIRFDRVYDSLLAPEEWLSDMAELIESSRVLHSEA